VLLWDLTSDAQTFLNDGAVSELFFKDVGDGRVVSHWSDDRTVRLRKPGSHTLLSQLAEYDSLVSLHDGRLVRGSGDGSVVLWDPTIDVPLILIGQHDSRVTALACLDDDRVASGSDDTTVRIWDPDTGAGTILGRHDGEVSTIATLGGGRIVSGSRDKTIRVWDAEARQQGRVAGILGFALTSAVASISVDRIRWRLVAGLQDGRVLAWAVEPEASCEREEVSSRNQSQSSTKM
jgi:WD40 repeat protein